MGAVCVAHAATLLARMSEETLFMLTWTLLKGPWEADGDFSSDETTWPRPLVRRFRQW